MSAPTDPQIIHHNGQPAFVVIPYDQYQAQQGAQSFDKRTTAPQEVVEMMVEGASLLKAWRKYFGLSQRELAERAGLTQAQVANIENGRQIPRADTLLKLSDALGVAAELLWVYDEDE